MDDTDISALDGHLRAQLERLEAAELAGSTPMLMTELSRAKAIIAVTKEIFLSNGLICNSNSTTDYL